MPTDSERLARLHRENAALRRALALVHRVATLVREPLELEPVIYAVLTGVTAGVAVGMNRAMVFMVDEDRAVLRGLAAVGPATLEEADEVWSQIARDAPTLKVLFSSHDKHRSSLDAKVRGLRVPLTSDHPLVLTLRSGTMNRPPAPVADEDPLAELFDYETAVMTPIRGQERTRGVLYADNKFTGTPPDPLTEQVLELIADHAGHAIDHALQFTEIARAAQTDALTGLGHHGAMMAAAAQAVDDARASQSPVAFAILDLDDFKQINDIHGHLVGDAILVEVASRLRTVARADEAPFRYGGEEFAVLLPNVSGPDARRIGERLRRAIADQTFKVGELALTVTTSIGIAQRDDVAELSAVALMEAADQCLLRAKRDGKNRVVCDHCDGQAP